MIRAKGFKFMDVHIMNVYAPGSKYFLLGIEESVSPKLRYKSLEMAGRNGSLIVKGGYEQKQIKVKLGIYGQGSIERNLNKRALLGNWLNKKDKLIFDDDPKLFYEAQILEAIGQTEGDIFNELTITFECSPFKYELYDDATDYVIGTLDDVLISDMSGVLINTSTWIVTEPTIYPIVNNGNFDATLIIELTGTGSSIAFTVGDTAFNYIDLVDQTITIDSEKMIVYEGLDGSKTSKLTSFFGKFPILPIGDSNVSISGTFTNLSVKFQHRNTYIV